MFHLHNWCKFTPSFNNVTNLNSFSEQMYKPVGLKRFYRILFHNLSKIKLTVEQRARITNQLLCTQLGPGVPASYGQPYNQTTAGCLQQICFHDAYFDFSSPAIGLLVTSTSHRLKPETVHSYAGLLGNGSNIWQHISKCTIWGSETKCFYAGLSLAFVNKNVCANCKMFLGARVNLKSQRVLQMSLICMKFKDIKSFKWYN